MELGSLRDEIDAVDREIVALLARRFGIVDRIAVHKAVNGIPMMQPGRVDAVKARARRLAVDQGLDTEFAERLFTLIIEETCAYEDGRIAAASAADRGA